MPAASGAAAPSVLRLSLSEFRNYAALRLDLDPRPVVLTGANGAGKTNLLEAISFLAPGRGLRRARLSEVTRRGAAQGTTWAVTAHLGGVAGGERDIGTGIEAGSERRALRIDGEAARSQGELAGLVGLLWLVPAMDRLFIEGATGRRRFLDRLVLGLDPGHAARAALYERALRERTRVLAADGDATWLDVLETRIAEAGTAMAAARLDTVARLGAACRDGVGPFPAAGLAASGEVEGWLETAPAADVAARFAAALARSRPLDRQSAGTHVGPHRSDLAVTHGGKGLPAAQCSTGEQKALLISILLGQARVRHELLGAAPVMLLDEITAHLDAERRAALFDELCALPAQSWLAGTDQALFEPLRDRAMFYRVGDGGAVPD